MNFETLMTSLRETLCRIRRLQTLLEKDCFDELFQNASLEERKKLSEFVKNHDTDAIKVWYQKHRYKQLELLSLRELRHLASRMGVPGYTTYSKAMLMALIAARNENESPTDSSVARRDEIINLESRCAAGGV